MSDPRTAAYPVMASMAVLLAFLGARTSAPRTPDAREVAGAPLYQVLSRDAIRALDEPASVAAEEARDRAHPEEFFLGVQVGGETRAYSTWLLESHELVNDTVAGVPIAASW